VKQNLKQSKGWACETPLAEIFFLLPGNGTRKFLMLAVQLMFTVQLGTPRGRYDEYSSKVFPQ
jgi:hypothetical protein